MKTYISESKVCYVCCVWFGFRRSSTKTYDTDRLAYFKTHVSHLQEFSHNLDKIVFVVNLEEAERSLFEESKKLVPRMIGGAEVEIVERINIGLSYGAWSDTFGRYRNEYDYFIFTEDDYYFNIDNFDRYLVNKFNMMSNSGYLCMFTINPTPEHPDDAIHAGNSVGISSTKVLNEVWERHGCLPHSTIDSKDPFERYHDGQEYGQVGQTHAIYQLGYNIWDVRDDYQTAHDTGPSRKNEIPDFDNFVEMYFYWNEQRIIVPAVMKFNEPFFFLHIIDEQFKRK